MNITNSDDIQSRDGSSYAVENFVEVKLLLHFFRYGNLATKEQVDPCTDDEYIGKNSYLFVSLYLYIL